MSESNLDTVRCASLTGFWCMHQRSINGRAKTAYLETMSNPKYAAVSGSEDLGYIDTVRRVSGIQLSTKKDHKDAADEQIYIEAIRRVSGVNVGATAKEVINARREVSAARIQAERGLSSAEIGVIEGVRRLSGINAALHELGEPTAKKKAGDIIVGEDGKITTVDAEAGKSGLGDREWHLLSQDEVFKELGTKIEGLSAAEAEARLAQYGLNEITPVPPVHWCMKLFQALTGGFQLMMWFGSILCWIVYGISEGTDIQTLALAIVLIVVVVVTAIFQTYQVSTQSFMWRACVVLCSVTYWPFCTRLNRRESRTK